MLHRRQRKAAVLWHLSRSLPCDGPARKDEARALLAVGKDLGEAKKDRQRQERARRGRTLKALALEFVAKAATEGRAASTQTKTEWLLGMANASFGVRPITEVSAPIIVAGRRKVEAKGNHETAKRLRAKIAAVFRILWR